MVGIEEMWDSFRVPRGPYRAALTPDLGGAQVSQGEPT